MLFFVFFVRSCPSRRRQPAVGDVQPLRLYEELRMNWFAFAAGAVLSWGVYGAMRHQGAEPLG